MTRVPDFYRNQHTTLDAVRAKDTVKSTCEICGTGMDKVRRYCGPCAIEVMEESRRVFARRVINADPDLTGKIIGSFTVLGRAKRASRGWAWLVRCECSKEISVAEGLLRSARKTHCGCKTSEAAS